MTCRYCNGITRAKVRDVCYQCQTKRILVLRLIRAGEPFRKLRKREQNRNHRLYLAELLRECGVE